MEIGRTGFTGEFRFLSNFWPIEVEFEGMMFPTVEHAYQAAKTLSQEERELIKAAPTPGNAKRLGRTLTMRRDWEEVKVNIMEALLEQKFSKEPLRGMLLRTFPATLTEGNHWHDNFWGQCICIGCANQQGRNELGKALMRVRAKLRGGKSDSSKRPS